MGGAALTQQTKSAKGKIFQRTAYAPHKEEARVAGACVGLARKSTLALRPPARQSAAGAIVCIVRMMGGLAVVEKCAHACNRVVVSHLMQTRCLNVLNLGPGFAACSLVSP